MSHSPITPPLEDSNKSHSVRRSTKQSKHISRASKRSSTTSSHEHGAVVIDGRHKRVWKACERCRMKKTKCDGESPCKRCKDDGLVCTAGSRKKTEFKQLPRGYAEVLENTQYALIATVQKLYTMIRNNEPWELGEPEMNDRGQPVIHDIASKLGCIRPSPDLPYGFPEGAEDFAELQAQLQNAHSEIGSDDVHIKTEESSSNSPDPARHERASSSESDHSDLAKGFDQWAQQQQQAPKASLVDMSNAKPTPLNISQDAPHMGSHSPYSSTTSFDTPASASLPSPIFTEFHTGSPLIRNDSPFNQWAASDEYLSTGHPLNLTANFMTQQQYQPIPTSLPFECSGLSRSFMHANILKSTQLSDGLNFVDGTIRPMMLERNGGYDGMESMMFSTTVDYDTQMGMA
ncbi:hypothetical protein B0O99DRAFT_727774 [Bisporella sp. PMI_857]|nr:hypothetical protein B0O99DRAFT_727774 [Bisporella sp. PMI_857]